jgi:hypothetical protein
MLRKPPGSFGGVVKLVSGVPLSRAEKVGLCVHDLARVAGMIPKYWGKSSGNLGREGEAAGSVE